MQEKNVVTVLKVGSALIVGFGFVIALAAYPPTSGIARFLLDLIKWPLDGAQSVSSSEMRLLSAVSGGVMVGWGVLLWLVSTRLYLRDPELARTMIVASIVTWFVIDSGASILAGASLNAVLNISFLILFVGPLIRAKRRTNASSETMG